nr:testis development-related protein [Manis javanica]
MDPGGIAFGALRRSVAETTVLTQKGEGQRGEDLVQGASFRGWKEVTSLFNKDDEQHLLERCRSPKSKGVTSFSLITLIDTLSDRPLRPGWEEDAKGSGKYSSLASSANSSCWSLKAAGKLVSIRRQSKGHLTDNWEELE